MGVWSSKYNITALNLTITHSFFSVFHIPLNNLLQFVWSKPELWMFFNHAAPHFWPCQCLCLLLVLLLIDILFYFFPLMPSLFKKVTSLKNTAKKKAFLFPINTDTFFERGFASFLVATSKWDIWPINWETAWKLSMKYDTSGEGNCCCQSIK